MSPVAKIRRLAWSCGCLVCNILNLFLAFFAIGQAGLLFLNFFQQDVPVPDTLTRWVLNRLGPEELEAEWDNATFDLRGGLLISGFQLGNPETEQIIATAEETHVQWTPLHLVLPKLFPIRTAEARDVEIYIPVSHSPSGLNEPVLFIRHVSLKEDRGELVVSSLIMESGGIRVHLEGSAPLHQLTARPEAGSSPRFYDVLKVIRRIPEDLEAYTTVNWKMFPSGDHLFRIEGRLPSLDYAKARLSSLNGRARIRLTDEGLALLHLNLDGSLQLREELPTLPLVDKLMHLDPVPFHLSADGPLRQTERIDLPSRIQLNLHPRDDSLPFHHLLLRTSLWQTLSPVHWIASSPGAFSEGWAYPVPRQPDPGKPTFPFKLVFRGYLPSCSLAHYLPQADNHRLLQGAGADTLQLNATFDPVRLSLDGSLVADGLFIGQTRFSRLQTGLHLDRTDLKLEDIHVWKAENEFATGSYLQHFPSSRFSLNAAGSIFPTSLDIILGRWWTRIFRNIGATEPLPADVTVWGRWRELKSLQSLTYVNGRNGSYRNVPIPALELRVRSNHRWAVLEHLRASFPSGDLTGQIAIRSGIEPDAPHRAMLLDLRSDVPWPALCKASGIDELCEMEFSANPHVNVRGVLWQDSGKGFKAIPQADLLLSLTQHEGTSRVQGLDLTGLTLTGRLSGKNLDLTGLSGGFADGVFAGDITIENWQDKENRRQHYDLKLFDAHFGSARTQLSEGFGYQSDAIDPLPPEVYEGRVDAKLSLSTGQSLPEAKGSGAISLRQAKLGEIHLFGGLSRFLSSMGLAFSSLQLDALSFEWMLSDGLMRINNGLVTGPALRLQLAGTVDLQVKQMAMQADVTLVKGMIGLVLAPVSENLQFDIRGSMEKPTWKVRFSPFNWLQESPTLGSPNPEL
jgi:hypothetical protein